MFSFSDIKMMYDWGCFTDDQVRLFVPLCQPDYTDGGFGSYHITVENNFDDARKPIVRFIDSPTTPVKKLAVRGFALVFAPAPTENSQVKE
ncbi:XkdX family protein [Enterococcus durans]|nr:XkdX family protein [Enterococcus durans]